jgi:hypothetical protein
MNILFLFLANYDYSPKENSNIHNTSDGDAFAGVFSESVEVCCEILHDFVGVLESEVLLINFAYVSK